jgi:hypothetical protein
MAAVTATSQSAGVTNFASGSFTSDNTITTVACGFRPRLVKVFNTTDVIVWEKFEGMGATTCIKTVAAGTTTADTTTAITLTASGFTLAQAAVGNSKAISWIAFG